MPNLLRRSGIVAAAYQSAATPFRATNLTTGQTGTTSTISITPSTFFSSAPVAGDTIILFAAGGGIGKSWSLLASGANVGTYTTNTIYGQPYIYKTAAGGSTDNITFTQTSGSIAITVYGLLITQKAFDVQATNMSAFTGSSPNYTSVVPSATLAGPSDVAIAFAQPIGADVLAPPSGYTALTGALFNGNWGNLYYKAGFAAGATGPQTFTYTGTSTPGSFYNFILYFK